jgi:SAM-dependent methyltransferase
VEKISLSEKFPLVHEPWLSKASRVAIAVVLLYGGSTGLFGQAPDNAADTARLTEILGLHEGSVVADIGAGFGDLTIPIARVVGRTGKVYSTDLAAEQLRQLREAAAKLEQQNVVVLEGALTKTNLPAGCCDGILMRDVYHHFGDPPAMNASLKKSLRPGGRLAVVDFLPASRVNAPPGRRDTGKDHGILVETLIQELKDAGFAEVQQQPWSSPGYFLVVGRRLQ